MSNESINWDKLGFDYIKTDKRYLSVMAQWRVGQGHPDRRQRTAHQ
ncbi:branched-chain amino acid aminotransferase [Pseudomonas putida S11]|nr:branched-chain amino acid aminotransferase [Pseudomonas putida S11]